MCENNQTKGASGFIAVPCSRPDRINGMVAAKYGECIPTTECVVDVLMDKIEMMEGRERTCATMDMAEKVALVKAIQKIARAVGLTDDNSPREIVERVELLSENTETRQP